MENVTRKVERMARRNAKRKLWRRVVAVPAALVVFVTTYALILPAIAMERETYCGYEAHTHDDTCYTDVLICGLEEGQQTEDATVRELACPEVEALHKHDLLKCYNAKGELICGYADYMVHQHDENCYINGVLVCPLTEVKEHEHTDACYNVEQVLSCGLQEQEGHVHDDSCYTVTESRDLTCGQEESAGHTHTDACYQIKDNTYLTCTQEESAGHTHTDACYTIYDNTYLACGQEESAGHTHTDACYTIHENTYLACGQEEGPDHTHTDACYKTEQTKELTCGQEEVAGHTHDASCYVTEQVKELTCGQEESAGHTHDASCYTTEQTKELVCGQEESAGHTHTDACYTTTELRELTCGKAEQEGHTHTDECYTEKKTLICGKKEVILHTHTASCFDEYGKLTCTQLEVKKHQHDENCFVEHELEAGQGHVHTEACYEHVLTCDKPEHIHTMLCYVNVEEETPAPTAEKNAAPAGSESQQPDTTPAEDDFIITLPEITSTPETSEEPEATAEPEVTEEPEATAEPEVTEEPETTEEPEATPEATEAPEPVLVCGLEEHTHTEDCYEAGQIVCGLEEHTHTDDCWAVPETSEEPEATPEATEAPMNGFDWGWGIPEGPSFDGQIIIPVPSATPEATAEPTAEPTATPEPTLEPTPEPTPLPVADVRILVCEKEEHVHDANCIMGEEYICGKDGHVHNDDCYVTVQAMLMCGLEAHTHTEECYAENGVLVCELPEHAHSAECIGDIVSANDGIMDLPLGDPGIMEIAVLPDFSQYIKENGITYSGVVYDPSTESWSVDFKVEFSFTKEQADENGRKYEFIFPEGVVIPEDELTRHEEYIDGTLAYYCDIYYDEVSGRYKANIEFLESYQFGQVVSGDFSFTGWGGHLEKDKDLEFDFADGQHIQIDDDEIKWLTDLYAQKKLNTKYDPESKTLTFTLDVWSTDGSGGPVTLHDMLELPDGVRATDVKVKSVTKKNYLFQNGNPNTTYVNDGSQLSSGEPNSGGYKFERNGDDFTLELPELLPPYHGDLNEWEKNGFLGEMYTVEYEYTLEGVEPGKVYDANNKATVDSEGDTHGEHTLPFSFSVDLLNKTVTEENGLLRWTIKVNEARQNINGWRLDDTFFQDNGISVEQLTITPEQGRKVVDDGDGKFHIEFTDLGDGKNTEEYTITYTTVPEFGYHKYTNDVTLDPTPGGTPDDEYHSGAEKDTNVGDLWKTHGDLKYEEGASVLPWETTVTIPAGGIPKGTVFTDTLTAGEGVENWMTQAQVKAMLDAHKNDKWFGKVGEWKFVDANGTEYTDADKIPAGAKIVSFSFTATEDITNTDGNFDNDWEKNKFSLKYDSTITSGTKGHYTNRFVIGDKSSESSFDGKSRLDKTNENGQSNAELTLDENGVVTWKVTINLDKDYSYIHLVDQLPEGVELDSMKYTVTKLNNKEYTATIGADGSITTQSGDGTTGGTGTYDRESGKIEFNIESGENLKAGGQVVFVYTCKITDQKFLDALARHDTTVTKDLNNTVTVKFSDGTEDRDEDNLKVKPLEKKEEYVEPVGKYSEYDSKNRMIHYTVDVNKGAETYLEGEPLTLEDVLEYACELAAYDHGSYHYYQDFELQSGMVKLYYALVDNETGKPILDENGHLQKGAEVPSDLWGWEYDPQYIPDYAMNRGNCLTSDGYKKTLKLTVPDGKALVLEYVYSATAYNPHVWNNQVQPNVHEPDTPRDDITEFTLDVTNKATLRGHSSTTKPSDLVWKGSTFDMHIYTNGLTIHKVEKGKYGVVIPKTEFTLFVCEGSDITKGKELVVTQTNDNGVISIYKDDDGKYFVKGVVAGEQIEQEVNLVPNTLYYFEETAPAGGFTYEDPDYKPRVYFWYNDGTMTEDMFRTEHGLDASVELLELSNRAHTVYVTNVETVQYELPETGGEGTIVFTLAGMAVMALAGAVYCDKRRRLLAKGAVTAPGVQFTAGRPERPAGQVKGGDRLIK